VNLSPDIDLGRSLRQVFANQPGSEQQIQADCARQMATGEAILERFFTRDPEERREISILADEVGLGKTYVALAVAVSILDSIRRGRGPSDLPANRPVILVLTPNNDALYNKWKREAESFRTDCARVDGALDWLQIVSPRENENRGNVLDITLRFREAERGRPMLMIAKQGALGAALNGREWYRMRALAIVFQEFGVGTDERKSWCRAALESGSVTYVPELRDLRRSQSLWEDSEEVSTDLYRAFMRALNNRDLCEQLEKALSEKNKSRFVKLVDDLIRTALTSDWPQLPLVVIDEIHGLKNDWVRARRDMEDLLSGKVCRLLGLSATPFQLRPEELLSVLKLRDMLAVSPERSAQLDDGAIRLESAIRRSKQAGEIFREKWVALRKTDERPIDEAWSENLGKPASVRRELARALRPPRIAHALEAALDLGSSNRTLTENLRPFVIRHLHVRGYREHYIGGRLPGSGERGTLHFSWAPGLEVSGDEELAHYAMMRAVALAKDEKGLPSLGAELTGSYRHLTETAALWRRLADTRNPSLREYKQLLDRLFRRQNSEVDPDSRHRKVHTTVDRALECFKRGQKMLIFCVYTKTAEAVRDRVQQEIEAYLGGQAQKVFGDLNALENFRRRFFNRREPLFSLIQDHPLLGLVANSERIGIPTGIALGMDALEALAALLTEQGEPASIEKPDRRLILAAVEHLAARRWSEIPDGRAWLNDEKNGVLRACPELADKMRHPSWLEAREPLSRSARASRRLKDADPEAGSSAFDPLETEMYDQEVRKSASLEPEASTRAWIERLRNDAAGETIAPYFRAGLISRRSKYPPLLAQFHSTLLARLNLNSRVVAGQVFRRILMAEEFLLRYLAGVDRNDTEKWPDYLSNRYTRPLEGHLESLRDRVHAYFETLERGQRNEPLRVGYAHAAENRNVVQLVKGGMDRDRYFLGFNTPYRPEILISTQVGAEGIDLHRECRHVVHHDLCWNPATIEQRTGRVDRIGSKVERERLNANPTDAPTLEIGVPYLAATYDERMFEELYRRAQLFEVTMGGDMRVEGRIEEDQIGKERSARTKFGIGTEDEDLGFEEGLADVVAIPGSMIESLRVDLAIWRPNRGSK
jgi:hypothetical protein